MERDGIGILRTTKKYYAVYSEEQARKGASRYEDYQVS